MNKVKYRNQVFIKRKRELIHKILTLTNQSPTSSFAKSLHKRTGSQLVQRYRREKTIRGIPSSFR